MNSSYRRSFSRLLPQSPSRLIVRPLLGFAVLMLGVCALPKANAAVVLTNGGFETTGALYNPALGGLYEASGWTNLSGLNIQACSMLGSQENMPAATEGARVLRFVSDQSDLYPENLGRIAQNLGTMAAGETYTITADALGGYDGLISWGATAKFVNEAVNNPSTVYATQTVSGIAQGVTSVNAFNFSYTALPADDGNPLVIWLQAEATAAGVASRGGIDNVQLTVIGGGPTPPIWVGGTSTNWGLSDNWNPVGVPLATDKPIFGNTGANPTVDLDANHTVAGLSFRAGVGTTIEGHTLTLDNGVAAAMISAAGNSHSINSAVALNSDADVRINGGQLDIGGKITNGVGGARGITKSGGSLLVLSNPANEYSGVTTVNAGVLSIAAVADGGLPSPIGAASGDPANLVLNSGTFRYTGPTATMTRGLTVGAGAAAAIDVSTPDATLTLSGTVPSTSGLLIKTGAGTLNLNTPLISTYNGTGLGEGSKGALNVTAGELQVDASGSIATTITTGGHGILNVTNAAGQTAALTVNGGSINVARLFMNYNFGASTPTFTLNSGSVTVAEFVGGFPNSGTTTSTININGGTLTSGPAGGWNNVGFILGSSNGGTCNVTVNQTNGLVSATGTNGVIFAASGGAVTATYNLDGGVLLTSAVSNPGGAPAANQTFTFGGGTLRASADNGDFMSATGIGNVLVKNGGAIIDTNDGINDHAITISSNLAPAPGSTGGLTKQGGGTLTLGGTNTYAGPTAITGGTLKLAAPSIPQVKLHLDATDAGTIEVGLGGKIAKWTDKSGAGNDAVPLGGSTGADYIASGGIAGNASVRFNNGVKTDRLTSTFDLNQKDITLAIVYQGLSSGSGSGNQSLFGHDEGGGWHRLQLLNSDVAPSISQSYGAGGVNVIIPGVDTSSATLYDVVSRGTVAGGTTVYLNGTGVATFTDNALAGTAQITLGNILSNDDTWGGNVQMGEVIGIYGALTDTQRTALEAYLNSRWFGGPAAPFPTFAQAPSQALPATDVNMSTNTVLDLNDNIVTIGGLNGPGTAQVQMGAGTAGAAKLTLGGNDLSGDFAGNIAGAGILQKTGLGTQILRGANTYTGLTTVQAGTLKLVGTTAAPNAWAPVLTGAGSDIRGGKMVFDYTGGSTPASTIQGLLTTSYAGGVWNTGKFRSTTADASHGLGWADDGLSQVKVAYTFYGDATLDGSVDATDLAKVLANYNQLSGMVWSQGDFDYNTTVDASDLAKVLANYNQGPIVPGITALGLDAQAIQMLTAAGFTVVPEPSTLVLLACGLLGLLAYGWRKRR